MALAAAIVGGYSPTAQADEMTAVIDQAPLASTTVQQSFDYDAVHHAYYIAQVVSTQTSGDFIVTKLSTTGKQLGHMRFNGFGHPVSIGVEPVGSQVYLWTEAKPKVVVTADLPPDAQKAIGGAEKIALGTANARTLWRNGATVTEKSSGVTVYGPLPSYDTQLSSSVDMVSKVITVRYLDHNYQARYRSYMLWRFKRHSYGNYRTAVEPPVTDVFQGWTQHAGTYWRLEGRPYSDTNPPPGNATVTQFTSDGTVSQTITTAGASLSYREPEGMAIIVGKVCVGFASGPAGARRANIYC